MPVPPVDRGTEPDFEHAFASALALHRSGQLALAEQAYLQLLQRRPDHAGLRRHLGLVLQQQGRTEDALAAYRQALQRFPAAPDLLLLVGMALRDLGRLAEARPLAARAAALAPRDAVAALLQGSVLALLGELGDAEQALRRALLLEPTLADSWAWLGTVLHRRLQWREAERCYRQALQLRSADDAAGDHGLQFNLALCAEADGRFEEAAALLQQLLALAPGRVDALARLAQVQAMLCDWEGTDRSVTMLEAALAASAPEETDQPVPASCAEGSAEPFVLLFLPLSAQAATRLLDRHVQRLHAEAAQLDRPLRPSPVAAAIDRPLRIGYLSPDFGEHAVGTLVQGVFAAHDRSRVGVQCFSLRRFDDAVAQAIRAGCDRFHDLDGDSAQEVAACIAAEGIDILVDLGGYTRAALPVALALRPAPVQIGWLGFLHSYGAGMLDYLLLDPVLAPPGSEPEFAEPLLRLPGFALPGAPFAPPVPASRATFGLPAERVLLASFNNSYKLDRPLFDAWLRVFAEAPDADLVLSLPAGAGARVAEAWLRAGMDPGRLHLVPVLPMPAHLARMACCDLFLDAFRYQGGASAMAAAAAGLPVLTRPGHSPVSRLGAAMNRLLGLEALVATDSADYIDRAIRLARDAGRRERMRAQLRSAVAASGLLDPSRSARELEQAYAFAWQRYLERSGISA